MNRIPPRSLILAMCATIPRRIPQDPRRIDQICVTNPTVVSILTLNSWLVNADTRPQWVCRSAAVPAAGVEARRGVPSLSRARRPRDCRQDASVTSLYPAIWVRVSIAGGGTHFSAYLHIPSTFTEAVAPNRAFSNGCTITRSSTGRDAADRAPAHQTDRAPLLHRKPALCH